MRDVSRPGSGHRLHHRARRRGYGPVDMLRTTRRRHLELVGDRRPVTSGIPHVPDADARRRLTHPGRCGPRPRRLQGRDVARPLTLDQLTRLSTAKGSAHSWGPSSRNCCGSAPGRGSGMRLPLARPGRQEVDVVLELGDGRVLAIEVKSATSFNAKQFNDPTATWPKFIAGIVLNTTDTGNGTPTAFTARPSPPCGSSSRNRRHPDAGANRRGRPSPPARSPGPCHEALRLPFLDPPPAAP